MPPKLNPKPKPRLSRKQVLNLFYIFAALIGVMLVQLGTLSIRAFA